MKLNFTLCYCHQFRIHFLSVFSYLNSWDGAWGAGWRPLRLLPRATNCLGMALEAGADDSKLLQEVEFKCKAATRGATSRYNLI